MILSAEVLMPRHDDDARATVGASPGWSFPRGSTDGRPSECLPKQNSAAAHAIAILGKVNSNGAATQYL